MSIHQKKTKKGFTLVELIIVITILSILATIAFISFQGYSKNARDGDRLTALRNMKSGLEIYYTKTSSYPNTESGTLIQSSGGTIIGYQGYFGDNTAKLVNFSKTPIDPYDGGKYIYSVNAGKNKFQILGYLETPDYLGFANSAYATDYSTRIPKTLGDNLGILLDANNNPISGTGIDIENYTGSLKSIFSNNSSLVGTGYSLKVLKSTYKTGKISWGFYDPNCDKDDIVIGNQVWAGCNSTLGNGIEWSGTTTCYNYSGSTITTDCSNTEYMASNKKEKSWSVASGVNGTVDNIWGKFYTRNNSSSACGNGWHVPTIKDWEILEKYIWNNLLGKAGDCNIIGGYECTGLGWKNNYLSDNNIVSILQIPLAGIGSTTAFSARGMSNRLWTSSLDSGSAYRIYFHYDHDDLTRYLDSNINNYYSVRCIRD